MIGSALSAEHPKASLKRSNSESSGCSCDRIVTGGLKLLNFGGIKMPASTAFDFQMMLKWEEFLMLKELPEQGLSISDPPTTNYLSSRIVVN
jgi:hypothetical protein